MSGHQDSHYRFFSVVHPFFGTHFSINHVHTNGPPSSASKIVNQPSVWKNVKEIVEGKRMKRRFHILTLPSLLRIYRRRVRGNSRFLVKAIMGENGKKKHYITT